MTASIFPGLEAHNPLGFLAALGLLRVIDSASTDEQSRPRLAFVNHGSWVASLSTPLSTEAIAELVLRQAAAQADNHALQLAYDPEGELVPLGVDGIRDLKPAPLAARSFLDQIAQHALQRTHSLATALAAAWFSDLVQDNNGRTKPTAFHFTAGQQAFLEMVETLRSNISPDDVREALHGPWLNTSQLPSLSWDASVARQYALRASNPAKEKRGSVPAANWLALIGLSFFPVVPFMPSGNASRRIRLETTGVSGGWKGSAFTWPVWSPPATARTIGSLVRRNLAELTATERSAIGISIVFRSRILRSDQGGYGSFTPAAVVPAYRQGEQDVDDG